MMSQQSPVPLKSLRTTPRPSDLSTPARGLASEIIDLWQQGQSADAQSFLAHHPELLADKTAVVDLAYEEYCQRLEAGIAPEVDAFCARFPAVKTTLRRLLSAHCFLAANRELLGDGRPVSWPEPGDYFLGFALRRELGRGAFARVFWPPSLRWEIGWSRSRCP